MNSRWRKLLRTFSVLLLVIVLTVVLATSALAATGIHLGTGNVYYFNGTVNYDVLGYVYYNSNTSSAIDIYSLCQWVYNYGLHDVDEVFYEVQDGNVSKYTCFKAYVSPIESGNFRRMEVDWWSVCVLFGYNNTSFSKNSSSAYAYTYITSGNQYGGLGGWGTFWYSSSYTSYFNY